MLKRADRDVDDPCLHVPPRTPGRSALLGSNSLELFNDQLDRAFYVASGRS